VQNCKNDLHVNTWLTFLQSEKWYLKTAQPHQQNVYQKNMFNCNTEHYTSMVR